MYNNNYIGIKSHSFHLFHGRIDIIIIIYDEIIRYYWSSLIYLSKYINMYIYNIYKYQNKKYLIKSYIN